MEENFKNLKKIDKELKYLNTHILKVGYLGKKAEEKPMKNGKVSSLKVKEYALIMEYGTAYIPSRPFFRNVTKTRRGKRLISGKLEEQVKEIIFKGKTGEKALEAVGIYTVGLIQESILGGNWDANSPSTLKNKDGNTPLVDTTSMLKAVSWEIVRG